MMLFALDAAARLEPVVRTAWMSMAAPPSPPGRQHRLAPGVQVFRQSVWHIASVLDTNASLPDLVEPVETAWILPTPAWHEWALCNGMYRPGMDDSDDRYFSEDRRKRVPLANEAKKICRACTVAEECLTYALSQREEFGIWAGTSGRQRAAMLERVDAGEADVALEVATWLGIR
jgi:hypothetical protein